MARSVPETHRVAIGSYVLRMSCLSCGLLGARLVCVTCRATLAPAAERRVGSVTVRPAFVHEGAARTLVHRLKYSALPAAGEPLARAMALLVPADGTALIPVPRVTARRWAYGVDAALELATLIGRSLGLPVVTGLVAPLWVRHRAGAAGRRRGTPSFKAVGMIPQGGVLVDDVVTSGFTLGRAGEASGLTRAVTATAGLGP